MSDPKAKFKKYVGWEWWWETGGQGVHNRTPETETQARAPGGHRDQEQGAEPLSKASLEWEVGGGEGWVEAQAVSDQTDGGQEPEAQGQGTAEKERG